MYKENRQRERQWPDANTFYTVSSLLHFCLPFSASTVVSGYDIQTNLFHTSNMQKPCKLYWQTIKQFVQKHAILLRKPPRCVYFQNLKNTIVTHPCQHGYLSDNESLHWLCCYHGTAGCPWQHRH